MTNTEIAMDLRPALVSFDGSAALGFIVEEAAELLTAPEPVPL